MGNVILKLYEGRGSYADPYGEKGHDDHSSQQDRRSPGKTGLKETTLKAFDASQYGGAPLLGLKGPGS